MKLTCLLIVLTLSINVSWSQEEYYSDNYEEEYLMPENDPSSEGQRFFVEDLLDMAGYVPEKIEVYQTLPNKARVFRVRFDSINGAFIFVRWDKKIKRIMLLIK